MKRITSLIILVALLIPIVAVKAENETVDLSADPSTRAQQAIALAEANGHDVQVSASDLAAFITELENPTFVLAVAQSDTVQAQGGVKQYKCKSSTSGAFTGLTVNWWAYARVVNGRIQGNPYNEGFNHAYYGVPGSYAVVTGSVTAYANNGGRRIRLDMNGTASIWFLNIHISTMSLNLTCSKSAKGVTHA